MERCDNCGVLTDERSFTPVHLESDVYFVCPSCAGSYSEEEFLERFEAQAKEALDTEGDARP